MGSRVCGEKVAPCGRVLGHPSDPAQALGQPEKLAPPDRDRLPGWGRASCWTLKRSFEKCCFWGRGSGWRA